MLYERDLEEIKGSESSVGVIKKWYDNRNNTFVKTSSYIEHKREYGVEAVMECIAHDIGKLLKVDVIPTKLRTLETINGDRLLVSVSKDYHSYLGVKEVIPAKIVLAKYQEGIVNRKDRYYKLVELFPNIKKQLEKMIAFDYLIDNYDRHLRNIEIVRMNNGIINLSPLFDNGSSLLANWSDEDLEDLMMDKDLYNENIVYAETPTKSFTSEHSTAIRLVRKETLRELNTFADVADIKEIVKNYTPYISELRVNAISLLLQHRYINLVDYLLKS